MQGCHYDLKLSGVCNIIIRQGIEWLESSIGSVFLLFPLESFQAHA